MTGVQTCALPIFLALVIGRERCPGEQFSRQLHAGHDDAAVELCGQIICLDERRLDILLDNCRRFAAGEPLRNVVDKANWF